MTKRHLRSSLLSRSSALAVLIAAVAAGPAAAENNSAASDCPTPQLSQPFTSWGDFASYTLAPGEAADNFAGDGWTLHDGANITTATLSDGTSGSVLDLPAGGYAVSPPMCVESDYRAARTMIDSENGAQVAVGVSYADSDRRGFAGLIQGSDSDWSLSDPLAVHPGERPGGRLVRFVFADVTPGADAQIYNFYVDPRMSD